MSKVFCDLNFREGLRLFEQPPPPGVRDSLGYHLLSWDSVGQDGLDLRGLPDSGSRHALP